MSGPVTVAGGPGSISVVADQLDELGVRLLALQRCALAELIPLLARTLLPDPAGALDPLGAARVSAAAALATGRTAVLVAAAGALAETLRGAAGGYRQVEATVRRLAPVTRAVAELPGALENLPRGPQAVLVRDPELIDVGVQLLTATAPGWARWPGGPASTARVAATAGGWYPDSCAVLRSRPQAATLDPNGPPRGVDDLLAGVALREQDDLGGGAVEVRVLDGPSGRRAIVDIAGTTSWDLDPLAPSGQASDFGTNLRSLGNQPSVLSRGVRKALAAAGVTRRTPVMLVGHSQGGMVAAELAAETARDGSFTITHVVTAGSPIGLAPVAARTSVLSLENRGDLVPQLDGADNPRRAGWLTATIDHGGSTVLSRHAIAAYRQGAADLDHDDDPALIDWRNGSASFFTATSVQTRVFQIQRR